MSLGAEIKRARKEAKLTLVELGEKINSTQGYLSNLEGNKRTPSPQMLKKIATTLNVSYFDLMVLAGYFDAEEAVERENIYNTSAQNQEQLKTFTDELHEETLQNLARLELGKFLLPETTTILLDGIELTDDEKQQLLNVARAMFQKKA